MLEKARFPVEETHIGAEARPQFELFTARLNSLLKKLEHDAKSRLQKQQGLKARIHFAVLTARLKPCPCYKT